MHKAFNITAIFLGIFLLTTAALAAFWAPGELKRTPLDTDSTTRLSGVATVHGPEGGSPEPVQAVSLSRADSVRSTDDVIVFSSSSCLVRDIDNPPNCVDTEDPLNRLISADTEVFATDRRTGLAVNDPELLPPTATERSGLINKWPFDTEKKDYPYWDGVSGAEVVATYQDETDIDGLKVYQFNVDVSDAPIEIAAGVPGKYTSAKQIFIDPVTGTIIRQTEIQSRVTDDNKPVLDLDFGFTDGTVAENVKDTKDSIKSLDLVTSTVPLVAGIVGLLLLIGGLISTFLRRRHAAEGGSTTEGESAAKSKVQNGRRAER